MSIRDRDTIQKFVDHYKILLATSRTLRDLYEVSTGWHLKNKACIYFDEDGHKKSYDYRKYKSLTFMLASRMSTALSGVPAGAIVGLKIRNCPQWPHLFWALCMCGHTPLLIDAKLSHENTANLLKQAKAKAIIVNEEEPYPVPSFRINEIRNSETDYTFAADWANQVIFCSSGTTGDAKMMITDGEALCYQVALAADMPQETLDILHPGEMRILAMIPFHHIFGFTAVFLWYTFYGGALVFPSQQTTRDILGAIRYGKCTHIYSVPLFWDAIAQSIERKVALSGERKAEIVHNLISYNDKMISREEAGISAWGSIKRKLQRSILGTHVEYCISGGGYLSSKTLNTINGLGYPLYDGYGMTEIGVTSVELSPRVEDRLKGSIGHPLHFVKYQIEPIEGAAPGQGQLWVSSPTIHVEEIIGGVRKKTMLKEGFYPTGDIVEKDASGSYYLKGRMKDTIINANGENVYPDEIEFYFKGVKHVNNCVVLGVKKEGTQEETITLVLELDNTVKPEELEEIHQDVLSVNAALPNEKRVGDILIYKRALPMANNMKVKRFVIKDSLETGSDDFVRFGEERKASSHLLSEFYEQEVKEALSLVRDVFAKALFIPAFKIADDAHWANDLGGDSMSYVGMVNDLNHEAKVTIPVEQYGKLFSVNDFAYEVLLLRHEGKAKQK
jgi:long-subunit acyl-CoA synthetase (AMP-forming)